MERLPRGQTSPVERRDNGEILTTEEQFPRGRDNLHHGNTPSTAYSNDALEFLGVCGIIAGGMTVHETHEGARIGPKQKVYSEKAS